MVCLKWCSSLQLCCGGGENYKQIISFPTHEEIVSNLKKNLNSKFISTTLPPKEFEDFFVVKKLENSNGLFTEQHKNANVSEQEILQNNLGISVIKSGLNFDDLAGAEKLKEWTRKFLIAEKKGYRSKGIFQVGLPGTGKTFFTQCLAGELNRPLVMLNLAFLQAKPNPIEALNNVFEYLNSTNSKQIILIDEIEKMIGTGEDPLTGRLMTILSDLYSPAGEYKNLDILVIATANNLNSILDHQPALLRRGRFDELFFQNTPLITEARKYFELYGKKYDLLVDFNLYGIDNLVKKISHIYETINTQSNNFIYTPAEISAFCKKLHFEKIAGSVISFELIEKNILDIIPIIKSAQKGVNILLAQKELFVEL